MADAVHSILMPSILVVSQETHKFLELRRRLLDLHPDLDEQTLADTLEGATNLPEALAILIRSSLEDEATVEGLKILLDKMKHRLSRLDARSVAKRQVVLEAMEQADIQKLQMPDFTASLRSAPPALRILHEQNIPSEFLVPQDPKIDRRGLLKAVTGGLQIPGVELAPARNTLTVRTL